MENATGQVIPAAAVAGVTFVAALFRFFGLNQRQIPSHHITVLHDNFVIDSNIGLF